MPIEEQTQYDSHYLLVAAGFKRVGQRLIIPNRKVTELAFYLQKHGNPTDPVTFGIRRVSDNSLIASKIWGNAGDLPEVITLEEVTLDTPPTINEEVRIYAEYDFGDGDNAVWISYQNSDVKADELISYQMAADWGDSGTRDLAYRYTYEEVAETAYDTKVGSPTSWLWKKCGYGSAEKCPVGLVPNWAWQAPTSGGPSKTPQGGPLSFIWGSE